MLIKNKVYPDCTISAINNFGYGVCRIEGIVVFVAGAVSGDVCDIQIIKTNKTWCVGKIRALRQRSSMRQEETFCCPHGNHCGGCIYDAITYEEELRLKENDVLHALNKAGATGFEVMPVFSNYQIAAYRNKAQYPVSTDQNGNLFFGFYAPRSHRVVPAIGCHLQPPIFSDIAAWVCHTATQCKISAYDETSGKGVLRHIYLRCNADGSDISLTLIINASSLPHAHELCRVCDVFPQITCFGYSVNQTRSNVIMGKSFHLLRGKPYITDVLCGKHFHISPLSFYQVNHDMAQALYEKAAELLSDVPYHRLLDLYCGIGTIGISVAKPDAVLYGVEVIEEAVKNAQENAVRNGFPNATYVCADAATLAKQKELFGAPPDAIIVDPPRSGLDPATIDAIAALAPKAVVYISCAPDTLARDLVRFAAVGYHGDTIYPYDLFPRTGHVETVVRLVRKTPDDNSHVTLGLEASF